MNVTESRTTHRNYNPNLEYLKELSGGDINFVVEIIEMFIKDTPEVLVQVDQYLENKNFDLLRVTVHKMKSSVQVLGCLDLARLLQEIEAGAQKENPKEDLTSMIHEMKEGVEYLSNCLHAEMKQISI